MSKQGHLFQDQDKPGVLRWSDDPMAGMIVGRRAPFVMAAVNAFHSPDGREIATEKISEGMVWEMRSLLLHISNLMDATDGNMRVPKVKEVWAWEQRVRALLAKLEE